MNNEARIEYLATQILYLNERHFLEDVSEISDEEYDMMYAELKQLDPENDVFNEVGASTEDIPDEIKVKHEIPMGSLAKALTVDAVLEWAKQFPNARILISRKMDGCAVSLKYDKGTLVLAATRGDGEVGENVTVNARQIDDIPETIENFTGEIRGEVYMTWATFKRLVAEAEESGKKPPVNPRNAAAGSLRQFKHPEVTAERGLSFVAYEIITDDGFETEIMKGALADTLGIPYVKFMEFTAGTFDALTKDASEKRSGLPYGIDGLVLTLDDIDRITELGMIGNSFCPHGKIAFKFPPAEATAVVNDITWQVGRTGKITPVAELEPTYVDGSTVSRATLHNHANILTLDLMIGDTVRFCKSGDIIPYIMRVEIPGKDRHGINYPIGCPSCQAITERDDVNVICTNPACSAQLDAKILHWLRRLDVKGVGSANIAKFRSAGLLSSLSDLYRIDVESIKDITGGEKSAEKIIQAIAAVKEVPLWTFLAGLGIPELGRTTSKMVAKEYKTLADVLTATKSELVALDGIGDITASHIVDGLQKMTGVIGELQGFVNVFDEVEKEGSLKGSSFCITGSISMGKKAAHKMIEDAGGEAWTSVKNGLTYLVTDNPNGTSSKMKKAAKLGVEVIDEVKMLELINE